MNGNSVVSLIQRKVLELGPAVKIIEEKQYPNNYKLNKYKILIALILLKICSLCMKNILTAKCMDPLRAMMTIAFGSVPHTTM